MSKSDKSEITPEEIKKHAKEEGLILLLDNKFGRENYISVQCSWPQLIRFAKKMISIGEKS